MSKKKEIHPTIITFKSKGVKPVTIEIKGIDKNHRLILDVMGIETLEAEDIPELHAGLVAVIVKILLNIEIREHRDTTDTIDTAEATQAEEYLKLLKKNGYKIGEA